MPIRFACFLFADVDRTGSARYEYVLRDEERGHRFVERFELHAGQLADEVVDQRAWYDRVALRRLWHRLRVHAPETYAEVVALGWTETPRAPETDVEPSAPDETPSVVTLRCSRCLACPGTATSTEEAHQALREAGWELREDEGLRWCVDCARRVREVPRERDLPGARRGRRR